MFRARNLVSTTTTTPLHYYDYYDYYDYYYHYHYYHHYYYYMHIAQADRDGDGMLDETEYLALLAKERKKSGYVPPQQSPETGR